VLVVLKISFGEIAGELRRENFGQLTRPPTAPTGKDPMNTTPWFAHALCELHTGTLHPFETRPDAVTPKVSAGAYTIWDTDGRFIYVGMSGKGLTAEVAARATTAKGLRVRLTAHASGRRSGDQFCLYVCDRFVVPALTATQRDGLADGSVSLDNLTRDHIRRHLSYRFTPLADEAQSFDVERAVQRGALPVGRPLFNPLAS
jgi:hypothetical protein